MTDKLYYICRYAPLELFAGFGTQTERLDPAPLNFDCADGCSHPNLCGFGKAVIEDVAVRGIKRLLLTDCCDVCRRLRDVLERSLSMEPCAFVHYSCANIHDHTLLECLQQPLFKAYRKCQPFNKNMLQPCPMLENPEKLLSMVRETGAKSTDMESPEDCEKLCEKCGKYAEEWKPMADRLWQQSHEQQQKMPDKRK